MVGARGRASHGASAVRPVTEAHCFFQGKREEGGESSAWLARGRASHMRPVTEAHCFFQGKREEGGEISAWLARVGAPRTALLPCDP